MDPDRVATQLNDLINSQSTLGWEFYQINSVNISISPGCLAGLFGAASYEKKYDMVIFRKSAQQNLDEIEYMKDKLSEIEEKKAALIKPLDSDDPRVTMIERNAINHISKLERNGYELVSNEISLTTELWVFKSKLDNTTFEMKSLKELSDFASNFK
jgi:hypothetical protein